MKRKEDPNQASLFPDLPRKPRKARELTRQQRILEDFAATWKKHVGSEYLINWGKDVKFVNALIDMNITPDEYQARKNSYFADRKWWEYGKWDFAVFVKHINKCVPDAKRPKTGSMLEDQRVTCQLHGVEHGLMQQCPKCYEESVAIMEKERNGNG